MSDESTENTPKDEAKTDEPGGVSIINEESFASMLEKSAGTAERLASGDRVKAQVVSVSGDLVYIDLGGKTEGVIDVAELLDENGVCRVKVGDEVEAFFVSVRDGVRRLTTLVNGYSASSLDAIRGAFEAGLPVNGEVKREVKGGFEISVGGVRSFCPFSQIDLKGGREGGLYLGRTFSFKVLEYGEKGKNIILSRRAVLDEERKARVEDLKKTLAVATDVTGTVRSIQNFGAFVDLGGVDGLIPASEMSWDREKRPQDLLTVGQEVVARVISLDWDNTRLTLSLKAMQPDPWSGVADRYAVDGMVNGTVVRLAPFGAFVRLEPGVEGLVHVSNLGAGRRVNHPKEVLEVGQWVEVYVLAVDPDARKISLSLQPRPKPQVVVLPSAGELLDGVVEKVMPFGVFVKLPSGVSGLIPNSELGVPGGVEAKRAFPAGMEVRVVVTDVDTAAAKVRLSRKAVMETEAREEYEEYAGSVKKSDGSSSGLGSFGEILKAKMEEKSRQKKEE